MKALIALLAFLVVAGLAFFLYSTPEGPPAEMTGAEIAQMEAEVEQLVRGLYEPLKHANPGPWMGALHEPAGFLVLGMDVGNFREIAAGIGEVWDSEETGLERQEIDDFVVQVDLISPTVAYAVCTSPDRRWHYRDGTLERFSTAETWILVLTDDGWNLHSGQIAMFPVE